MVLSEFGEKLKAGAITKGAATGAALGAKSKIIETAARIALAKNKGKALKEATKGTGKRILKGTAAGAATGAALKGYKHARGFGKKNYFHFSPVLSQFARTKGAKDKKKRKARVLKGLLIGGLLGAGAFTGAKKLALKERIEMIANRVAAKAGDLRGKRLIKWDTHGHDIYNKMSDKQRTKMQNKLHDEMIALEEKTIKKLNKVTNKRLKKDALVAGTLGAGALAMAANRDYTFSPVLSQFARTEGAKDKKPRKKRGLGKKLLTGAGIGALGLAGARYGMPGIKGGILGVKQLKRYGAPLRKNLKYIGDAAKGGVTERFGQDKALVQELLEKYKNRKVDPLADVDTRGYLRRKYDELVPDEMKKPLEITDKIFKGYTKAAYDTGRVVERGSNIKRGIEKRVKKVKKSLGIKDKKKKKGKGWKPPWSGRKWRDDRKWSTS